MDEIALWRAVIRLAMDDAFGLYAGKRPLERRDALAFLTDSHGPWARARREVAELADIDEEWLYCHALDCKSGRARHRSTHFVNCRSIEAAA